MNLNPTLHCPWSLIRKLPATLALTAAIAVGTASAQVTLTVTPAVVSNTYAGTITLNITGLNSGEQVYVGKWIDLDGNGMADPGEPLMDAFQLIDNDNSYALVGGITNINMPFDVDPAPGTVSATLTLPAAMPMETMVGHYVYQVLSPVGRFAPVAATFAITNATLPQMITGTIYHGDGTAFPYAVAAVQDAVHGNIAGMAVSDGSGHYAIASYPGEYSVIGARPGYYSDTSAGASFYLTNGTTVTNDLVLTNGGPYTISGTVYDQNSSNGVPGLLLQFQSGNFFEVAFTDTNGSYSAAVPPGFWKIQPSKERLVRQGYVCPLAKYQVDATAGSVTNANLGLPDSDALVYGRVVDSSGQPVVGIKVNANQTNYDSKGYTDTNGDYAIAVLDGQNGCNLDTPTFGSSALNFVWNSLTTVNLSPGQTARVDYNGQPVIGTITGHVQDNSGTNVAGVSLYADANIGGQSYTSFEGVTDDSGHYTLSVAAGQWNVYFNTGGFPGTLDAAGYEDLSAPHNVGIPPTNAVLNLTVYPLGTPFLGPPQFIAPGQFGFSVSGANNVNYTLQVLTNLADGGWQNVYSFQLTTNSLFISDPTATNSSRFYRVIE
ncbi:MAG TPA: carboxypeptidase-like regulatory domain-containing protein [Verrucomicrobiae bacterium]|nr:carboxypeptidase-like regulatory domain-containing protein [Verrucomicrobiae bacterium]